MIRFVLAVAASLGLVACGLEPVGTSSGGGCSAARARADGGCCPPWTHAQAATCAPRAWAEPRMIDERALGPVVAVAPNGEIALAWLETVAPLIQSVVVAHEADGFALRSPTAPLLGSASEPQLAAGADGTVAVAWRRAYEGQTFIEASVREDDGRWRDEPLPLSFPPDSGEPDVAVGDDGEILVAYNQWTGENYGVALARRPAGKEAFERPHDPFDLLSPLVQFSNDPEVVINARGDAIISWYQSLGEKLVTLVNERRGRHGSFGEASSARTLSPTGDPVEDPVVDLVDDGRAVVAWRQEVGDQAAVFLAERDAQGIWTAPATAEESFSVVADEVWDVRVALADDGSLYVLWEQEHDDEVAIMAAHRDGSGRWLASGRQPLRLSSPTVSAVDPVLAMGDDGHVVAAWTELDEPEWRVVARRTAIDAEGTTEEERWVSAETLSLPGAGTASKVTLAVGGDADRVGLAFVQADRLYLVTLDAR